MTLLINQSWSSEKAVMQPTQQYRGETSRMSSSGVESGILSEALELSHAMGKMKKNVDGR